MHSISSVRMMAARVVLASAAAILGTVAVVEASTYPRIRQAAAARNLLVGYTPEPLAGADSLRPSDQLFLERALAACRLQLRIAELGTGQASRADVRDHCEQLRGDNRQLADMLSAVLHRKASASRPVAEVPASDEIYAKLSNKSADEFDREFVRVMGDLHDTVNSLFEQVVSDTRDSEVKDLAAAQLPTLRAHRNRIVELRQAYE